MKITRYDHRVLISCTAQEFEILGIAVDQIAAGDYRDHINEPGMRKTWGRRVVGGAFLRVDKDKRTENTL